MQRGAIKQHSECVYSTGTLLLLLRLAISLLADFITVASISVIWNASRSAVEKIRRQKREKGVSVHGRHNRRKRLGFEEGKGHNSLEAGGSQCYADLCIIEILMMDGLCGSGHFRPVKS